MAGTAARSYRILVGVDLGELSSATLERAFDFANIRGNAEVYVVHVEPDEEKAGEARDHLRQLAREEASAFELGPDRVRSEVRVGRPAEELLGAAAEVSADLVVLGRPEPRERPSASVAQSVARQAGCPVLLEQPKLYEEPEESPCADCSRVRQESGGEVWFCERHSEGKEPRLSGRAGDPELHTGWGLF